MDKSDWQSAVELDAWTNELERLSTRHYKTADAAIFNAYKETLAEMKVRLKEYVDNYQKLTFSQRIEAERLFRSAGEIDQLLSTTFKKVGLAAATYKTAEAELGYAGVFYAIEGRDNLTFGTINLDRRFIETAVNAPVADKRLSERLYTNRKKLARATTSMIIRETAKGKGYAHIAKRVADQTEASYKQSMRIARTEAGRVRSIATQQAYEDAHDLGVEELQKKWVAGMDSRTRESHGIADGQVVGYDEDFHVGQGKGKGPRNLGHPGEDINCRCTTIAVVGQYDPSLRRIDGEVTGYKTYTEWAKDKI